ncbi:hypothetical protein [Streptomyces sp. CB02959]|uniref:hypothetical protein n=1 Tax=Streptomyces sp. CB02959 TaxID=2020330 RepID=UPI0011AF5A43|nr:hypothetical protein [Streptomyces sp. CB02959]
MLTLASLAGPRQIGIPVALAVIWGFTAVLTPHSTSLTRGTGYVAVAAIAVQLVGFVTHFWDDLLLGLSIWWPFLTLIVLTIPSYFYREIKTRRAASSTSTPRMARRRLTRLRTVPAGRDIGEIETEPVPPPALTRKLSTGQPEAEDAAQSTDAEPPKSPASAPRWTQSRGVQLLMALSMTLVLAATAVIYYSSAARHRDTSSPPPSASATPAAQYLRMPNLCGYVQNNEMRGRAELQPGSDEPGLDGRNDSRHANCGWGSAPSVKENRSKVVITATLYGTVAGAKDAMAAITLGRSTIDVALTTSKVDDTENIPEEAKKTVQDEDATNGDRYNSTTVYFRRNNVVVEVWYVESKVQMNDTNNKDEVTGRALTWGRSLDNFLRDEPENHEQPIWG